MLPQIFTHSLQLAQNNAIIAHNHGKSIESCGLNILKREKSLDRQFSGKLIQEHGKQIQKNSRKLLVYSLLLQEQDDNSINLHVQVIQEHIAMVHVYIKAVSMYTSSIQNKLKTVKK